MNSIFYEYFDGLSFPVDFVSHEVDIGGVVLGGNQPVRVQSMTNTNTMDTMATVQQTIDLVDSGCELVRITIPGIRDAENLLNIKNELAKRGCSVPLIADVHYRPEVAEVAASIVDKVRINPGNYTDGRVTVGEDYTDKEYDEELERIAEKLIPLLKVCKQEGTAIRIGSNHGSISKRIVNRYGNTVVGMVESAMEFARICRDFGFNDLVLSMKASNLGMMIRSTRLLVAKMMDEGMSFPVHLGVTEAGAGLEGRVKSAAGIGSLLEDGIGDTIRVSLTENPVQEIPFARELVKPYNYAGRKKFRKTGNELSKPFQYKERNSIELSGIGASNPVSVIGDENSRAKDMSPDLIMKDDKLFHSDGGKAVIYQELTDKLAFTGKEVDLFPVMASSSEKHPLNFFRSLFSLLNDQGHKLPVILKRRFTNESYEDILLRSTIDFSSLLIDGYGDGIWIEANHIETEKLDELSYAILQATGVRISKTEFIACPSCGRTKFDIETALKQVQKKTSHLKGLKIAVMGCIVNGPGEMADADYGYVGAGNRKVSLYKKQTAVMKNVDEDDAVDELISLIRASGDWVDI